MKVPKRKPGRPRTGRQPRYSLSVRHGTYQRLRMTAAAQGKSINALLADMLDREAQLAFAFASKEDAS